MLCPTCQKKTEVLDSRQFGDTTRRGRRCKSCGIRFRTIEVLHEAPKPKLKRRPKPKPVPKSVPKKKFRPKPAPRYDYMTDEELENAIFDENFRFDEDEI